MANRPTNATSFGQKLRGWRRLRGLSQLELANLAGTTPRHVSFIETGRSRPGREVILRIADCLDLSMRDSNALLTSAGLPPAYAERRLDEKALERVLGGMRGLIDRHEPFPAAAIDEAGKVHLCNGAYRRIAPHVETLTPETLVEQFYGEVGRAAVENWEEVAWATAERRRRRADRTGDARLARLADRAFELLRDVPRPRFDPDDDSPFLSPRLRVGSDVIATYSSVVRFETARDVTLSELRVELIYPVDEAGVEAFRALARGAPGSA